MAKMVNLALAKVYLTWCSHLITIFPLLHGCWVLLRNLNPVLAVRVVATRRRTESLLAANRLLLDVSGASRCQMLNCVYRMSSILVRLLLIVGTDSRSVDSSNRLDDMDVLAGSVPGKVAGCRAKISTNATVGTFHKPN